MKYLQIYDHNDNLSKEFPIYVEGADFSWSPPHPEAIWLGTIRIVSEPSEVLVVPMPEPEPEAEPMEYIDLEIKESEEAALGGGGLELEEKEETGAKAADVVRMEADLEWRDKEKEVNHEPEKRVHKGRRKPGVRPPDGAEGAETVSE